MGRRKPARVSMRPEPQDDLVSYSKSLSAFLAAEKRQKLKESDALTALDYRKRHDDVEPGETIAAGVMTHYVRTQTSLDRYHRRRLLGRNKEEGDILAQAGEEYQRIVWYAGFTGAARAVDLTRIPGSPPDREIVTEAMRKLFAAEERLGEAAADCLRKVIVEDWSADAWAKARGHRANGVGLAFLVDGLRVLAAHWRMLPKKA